MRRHHTLLLLCLSATACAPVCDAPTEAVDETYDLTEADVQEILDGQDLPERTEITCEQACDHQYVAETGNEGIDVDDCTITLDETPGDSADAVVGAVSCVGTGVEYYCE